MDREEGCLFPNYTKAQRVIELYRRIRCGLVTKRENEARIFGVDEESIKAYDMAIILTTLMQAAQSHNIFSFTKRKC